MAEGLFNKGEYNAMIAATGAGIGLVGARYIPQFLGKFTNLAIGAILLVFGAMVGIDVISYLSIGAGFIMVASGLVNMVLPQYSITAQMGASSNNANASYAL